MQVIIQVELSVEQYVEEEFQRRVRPPERCGNCGQFGTLTLHAYYDRDTTGAKGEPVRFWVARFICDACDRKWKIKVVDSDFMLGVKRELKDKDGEFSVTMNMTAYVDGIVEAFKDELPDRVNTPFPEHDKGFITKNDKVSDDDAKMYLGKGYMRMCGLILWAARNCFPECSLGASFLCRVMSRPSKKAYEAGLHMIRWLGQNRLRGIKFTHDQSGFPVAFSDASNKSDPTDSCKQYGYCIMWQGGPMAYVSKKLSHIGHHSAHNEYMALAEAGKAVVWLRQLLTELEMFHLVDQPTTLFGDNNVANALTADHFVSYGNQFIYLPYHAIKEWVELGFIHVARKKSKHNLSDLMTKNVSTSEIKMLLDVLTGYKRDDTIMYIADLIRSHDDRTQYVLCALVSQLIII